MVRLTGAKLRAALACIAEATAGADAPTRLGDVTLHQRQRDALSRAEGHLARFGGALLAEEVGRGKSFIALAVAARFRCPLVVLPASLRDAWHLAMTQASVPCACITHEALSAGRAPAIYPDLVVIDESHRFRNPRTRRYRELVGIAASARVLLLSATPLQNSRNDLAAQLALFLGGATEDMSDADLASHLVRSGAGDAPDLPRVAPPEWVTLPCDDGAVLDAILSLPPPPRALDAGDAGVLRMLGLVRAWASSRAALRAMLRRRARALAAMEQCAHDGRVPTTAELRSWSGGDGDVVQLGFASLLARNVARDPVLEQLHEAVEMEGSALARIQSAMRSSPDPDSARVEALRELRTRHRGEKLIAFTELASTASAMASALLADGEVGMLTATRARIASGSLTRRELLARFAPMACAASPPAPRERVSLLIATDLLSEGVNLQDASVVVHLDLPWNPARLTQRMGRVRRPGGRELVHGYLVAPPARAEHLLRVEQRLRAKLASAVTIVGSSFSVVPVLSRERSLAPATAAAGVRSAESRGEMLRTIAQWRRAAPMASRRPIIAAVECSIRGWLAVTRDGRMTAWLEGAAATEDCAPSAVALLNAAEPRPLADGELRDVMRMVSRALARARIAQECGATIPTSRVRDATVRRVSDLLATAPRHRRAELLGHAATIRRACASHLSLGIERELERLTDASSISGDAFEYMERAAWLLRDCQLHDGDSTPDDQLVAVILLGDPQCAQ